MARLSSEDEADDNRQADIESSSLTTPSPTQIRDELLTYQTQLLAELSEAADSYVRRNLFTERQERKAWNTVRKEIAALSDFMTFLNQVEKVSRDQKQDAETSSLFLHLAEEPRLWAAITFGLVKLFLAWEQQQGYAIKTINDHLDVIKLYARLAQQAGYQTADQMLAIKHIARIRGAEAERIDAVRVQIRRGQKKTEPTFLDRKEYQRLLNRPDTPQGWRDRVAILLMYELSLRPSEVVSLKLRHVHLDEGTIDITRHKTHDQQKARLKDRLYPAMMHYINLRQDRSPDAPLLVRSLKNGQLVELVPLEAPEVEAAKRGGRRPSSPNRALYVKLQPSSSIEQASRKETGHEPTTWTPPMTTRGLREHLHELGLDIAQELYGEDEHVLSRPRPQRSAPEKHINLTSYDGRHEWTRNAIRGGSNPIAVTKAGGWKGHSAMVERYYGELDIINEDIVLAR